MIAPTRLLLFLLPIAIVTASSVRQQDKGIESQPLNYFGEPCVARHPTDKHSSPVPQSGSQRDAFLPIRPEQASLGQTPQRFGFAKRPWLHPILGIKNFLERSQIECAWNKENIKSPSAANPESVSTSRYPQEPQDGYESFLLRWLTGAYCFNKENQRLNTEREGANTIQTEWKRQWIRPRMGKKQTLESIIDKDNQGYLQTEPLLHNRCFPRKLLAPHRMDKPTPNLLSCNWAKDRILYERFRQKLTSMPLFSTPLLRLLILKGRMLQVVKNHPLADHFGEEMLKNYFFARHQTKNKAFFHKTVKSLEHVQEIRRRHSNKRDEKVDWFVPRMG